MIAPAGKMNETDQRWIEDVLGALATNAKIAVLMRGNDFTLHEPTVSPGETCDFEVRGKRRVRVGEERHWRPARYAVAKILRIEKGRLICQDIYGGVLVFTTARPERKRYEMAEAQTGDGE